MPSSAGTERSPFARRPTEASISRGRDLRCSRQGEHQSRSNRGAAAGSTGTEPGDLRTLSRRHPLLSAAPESAFGAELSQAGR